MYVIYKDNLNEFWILVCKEIESGFSGNAGVKEWGFSYIFFLSFIILAFTLGFRFTLKWCEGQD